MLDSELNSHDSDNNPADSRQQEGPASSRQQESDTNGRAGSRQEPASVPAAPAVPAALFQAPQVLFQPPAPVAAPPSGGRDAGGSRDADGSRDAGSGSQTGGGRETADGRDASGRDSGGRAGSEPGAGSEGGRTTRTRSTRGGRGTRSTRGARTGDAGVPDDDLFSAGQSGAGAEAEAGPAEAASRGQETDTSGAGADEGDEGTATRRTRRRRNTRSRTRSGTANGAGAGALADETAGSYEADDAEDDEADEGVGGPGESTLAGRRRRRKRRRGSAEADVSSPDDPPDTVVHVREAHSSVDDVRAIKGSTRLEAKKQRRREGRESGRRRPPVITESEFLARRESVERTMVVRQRGDRTQIAVLEDGVLVEHYVNRTTHQSYVGNVYLGKVQNVLPSMEAAFVDIGKGRNAVLYAGEVNFDASGLEGQPKRIEAALKPGQSVIVQVTKDPVGHKGARLTSQVSLPGRYLVYVPGASMTGISRKLPDTERNRLKGILKKVTPENGGVIVRTAAEGAAEAELDRDVTRLAAQWENIEKKAKTATAPSLLYGEPDLTIRVVRDVFNEDFSKLIVSGDEGWDTIDEYVRYVAPHLADRLNRWEDPSDRDDDVFTAYRIDEQLAKALERKVWLPSGGSLVIDRTEAMTVVDVNTGKFTGQGGNLEETVTRNNLEAAEEIVRQLRLRDVGGIVVIDFIDMVLESNRELVLRRLLECLARDRTKHQVAEVTSLGLVQMTRKRVGAGLLEAFSQPCECCNGRGVIITLDQPEPSHRASAGHPRRPGPGPGAGNGSGNGPSAGQSQGAGNGQGAPSETQERPWQDRDRPGSEPAGSERPGQDRPAQDRSRQAAEGSRSRRGRRDGRTNGGTASASIVEVAETPPPAVTPVAVLNDAPAAVTPAPVESAVAPTGVPGRRTRAGSAMARVSVSSDEPAPVTTVPAVQVTPPAPTAPEETQAPAAAPASIADVALPAELSLPAEVVLPAEVTLPAEVVLPADDALPVDEPVVGDVLLPPEAAVAGDAILPVDVALPVDEPVVGDVLLPADMAPPAEVALPADLTPPAEVAPVEEAAPAPDLSPMEAAAPALDDDPVADASAVEEAAPAVEVAAVEEPVPVADLTPVAEEAPAEASSDEAPEPAEPTAPGQD